MFQVCEAPTPSASARLEGQTDLPASQFAEHVMNHVTAPVAQVASAGLLGHSVVLTLIFPQSTQPTIETAPRLAQDISRACRGDWTLNVTVPGAGCLQFGEKDLLSSESTHGA